MKAPTIVANGKPVEAKLPCTIEQFLVAQALLPRSVVVEHNSEAVAPSEFSKRQLNAGDRLEIVKIVGSSPAADVAAVWRPPPYFLRACPKTRSRSAPVLGRSKVIVRNVLENPCLPCFLGGCARGRAHSGKLSPGGIRLFRQVLRREIHCDFPQRAPRYSTNSSTPNRSGTWNVPDSGGFHAR
jgi:thiamine biosynthesis protein ThiS